MKESGPQRTKLKSCGAMLGGVLLVDSLCSGVSESLSVDSSRTSRSPLTYDPIEYVRLPPLIEICLIEVQHSKVGMESIVHTIAIHPKELPPMKLLNAA